MTKLRRKRPDSYAADLAACVSIAAALLSLALLNGAALAAQPVPADALLGAWKPVDRDVIVKIERAGTLYTGTVVASAESAQIGKVILRGLAFDEAQNLYRGEAYAARRGAFVPAVIYIEDSQRFRLTAGSGIFSREVIWHRQ